MRKLVVYCHGYNGSPASEKVARLRETGASVYAWNIDIDPSISLPYLEHEFNMVLLDDLHSPLKLVFVGTSLGGWYAAELAAAYQCDSVIINPSYNPRESLAKYGIAETILEKYTPIKLSKHAKYFFGANDDVIDYSEFLPLLAEYDFEIVAGAGHRFDGKEFDRVTDYIQQEHVGSR